MPFDSSYGYDERFGDVLIRRPVGCVGEDLQLPWGEQSL